MRKVLSIFLALVLVILETSTVVLAATSTNKGIYSVKCVSTASQATVEVYLGSYTGYSNMYLANPNRIVIDIKGTKAPESQVTVNFTNKFLKSVRYALRGTDEARVVIDVKGKPNYKVQTKSGKIVIIITNPITAGLSYFTDTSSANIMIGSLNMYVSGKKKYTEKFELSGKRLTIKYSNTIINLKSITKTINDKYIKTIKVVNNSTKKTTEIIIDAVAKFDYKPALDKKINSTIIRITKPVATATATATVKPTATPTATRKPTATPTGSATLKGVTYYNKNGITYINIAGIKLVDANLKRYYSGAYSGSNLTYTIKFKTSLADLTEGTLAINDLNFKTISIKKDAVALTTSISISSKVKYSYNMTYDSTTGKTKIVPVSLTPVRNMSYARNGDRITILLKKAHLTELIYNESTDTTSNKAFYTKSYEESGGSCTITFPTINADLGTGVFLINDNVINSIEVTANTVKKTTSVTFNTKKKYVYNIITATSNGLPTDTTVTILEPHTLADKLVVIDAGHGGYDPGAVSGSIYESNINLDIANRLNALLKAKGVKTYMIREDDTFVGLYERAYIANTLTASLFLCIHNNASESTSAHGTETYYTSRSSTGYNISSFNFSKIIQNSLISRLKSYDRGSILRPNLVVLKATKMPAVLTEIGFISNAVDRANLCSATYKQNAAQALCDGVIASLAYK